VWGGIAYINDCAIFLENPSKGFGAGRPRKTAFPIDFVQRPYNSVGTTVLFSIDFFVSMYVCMNVCIYLCFFVIKITRKRLDRFARNFQGRCGMTMGLLSSILDQFGETARYRNANFFYIICQHYEQTARPICMKLSGKVWSDHVTT